MNQIPDYSTYTGIVVQNNDPLTSGRIKVFVPGITNTVYDGWNSDYDDKEFSFIDGSIVSILDQLREDLPWADCACNIFGGDSSQVMLSGTATDLTQPAGIFSIPSVGAHVNILFKRGNRRFPTYYSASHGTDEWTTAMGDDYPTEDTDTNVHVINSSKHGFRFVDTADREEILLQHYSGSYNQFLLSDRTCHTVENKIETVGIDNTMTVSGNDVAYVKKDKTSTVGGSENIEIEGSRTINIGGSDSITVGSGQTVTIGGDLTFVVKGSITIESAGGKIVLDASGVTITGTAINLN